MSVPYSISTQYQVLRKLRQEDQEIVVTPGEAVVSLHIKF